MDFMIHPLVLGTIMARWHVAAAGLPARLPRARRLRRRRAVPDRALPRRDPRLDAGLPLHFRPRRGGAVADPGGLPRGQLRPRGGEPAVLRRDLRPAWDPRAGA